MPVSYGGGSIDGSLFPEVWKSASARGNLMRVMRLSLV